jgi:hypothetical protein
MNSREKTSLIATSTIIVLLIVFTINWIQGFIFTKEKWLDNPNERVRIVDNLLYRYEMVGMDKKQVINLLGEDNLDRYYATDDIFVYHLGSERGLFSIDDEFLEITFINDKVVKVEVVTD